jgi:hypothetical protein
MLAAGRRLVVIAAVAAAPGCDGGGGDGPDGGGDDDVPDAAPPLADAPPGCSRPGDDPPWLGALVDDTVGRLSGQRPIRAGVTLANRASATNRNETRIWLDGALAAQGYTPARHDYGNGENVYGELPATVGPGDEWIVVGAHFDTVAVSPGANDNATGVAVVLAAARQLRELTCRQRGVIVVFLDQEEIGLVGAGAFADRLVGLGTNVVAVHTIDQAGWDADGDRRFELERPAAGLQAAYATAAARLGASVVMTSTMTSDHQAFRQRGFAAVGVTEEYVSGDTTPHYHLASDTFATVNQPYTRLAARLVAETVMDQVE